MSSPLIWPVCDDSSAKSTLATGPGIIQRRRPRPVRKSQSSKMMIMNGNSKRTTYQLVHKAGSRMWWSSSPQDESKAHSSGVRLEKDSRSCVWGVIMNEIRYGESKFLRISGGSVSSSTQSRWYLRDTRPANEMVSAQCFWFQRSLCLHPLSRRDPSRGSRQFPIGGRRGPGTSRCTRPRTRRAADRSRRLLPASLGR